MIIFMILGMKISKEAVGMFPKSPGSKTCPVKILQNPQRIDPNHAAKSWYRNGQGFSAAKTEIEMGKQG